MDPFRTVVNGLGLRRVAAKLVPKELNFMQKRDRVVIAKDMISKAESDPTFIKRIIIGDETFYEYDTQFRHQASEWKASNEPRPKKTTSFSVEKESDAHGFHGLQRYCISRIFARRSDS